MTVTRCYRFVKPANYRRYIITEKETLEMILVWWLYFICALFYPPIENSAFMAYGQQLYLQGFQTNCIIFYCYLRIFKTLRSHNNFHPSGNPTNALNVEVKVARTVFVTEAFLICVGQLSKDGSLLLRFPWHKRFWPLYAT